MPRTEKYPVSMLRARAREKELETQQASFLSDHWSTDAMQRVVEAIGWERILNEFQLSGVERWGPDEAPLHVMSQLIGQTIGFGMKVTYENKNYLVVDLDIRPQDLGRELTWFDLMEYWPPLVIVPLQYIDLNS